MKNKGNTITLYHGTTTKYLDHILKQGITPRYKNNIGNWKDDPSREDMVYLSDAYACHFAYVTAGEQGGDPLVLQVNVNNKRLYPDEDYLEQFTRLDPEWKSTVENTTMSFRTKFFKDRLLDYKDYYEDSLRFLGNVCHKGIIKPKNIIRYSILDDDKVLQYSDPTITLKNYMFLGDRYRELSRSTMWEKPLSKFTGSANEQQ